MKRILVCFDGSEGAEKALNKAITLMDDDGELLLLAVVPAPSDRTLVDANVYAMLKKKAPHMDEMTTYVVISRRKL